MEFIGIDGLRADGRRAVELRRIKCELGALENVDGSAQVEMGLSKVGCLCAYVFICARSIRRQMLPHAAQCHAGHPAPSCSALPQQLFPTSEQSNGDMPAHKQQYALRTWLSGINTKHAC